jgi:hypothetical protein
MNNFHRLKLILIFKEFCWCNIKVERIFLLTWLFINLNTKQKDDFISSKILSISDNLSRERWSGWKLLKPRMFYGWRFFIRRPDSNRYSTRANYWNLESISSHLQWRASNKNRSLLFSIKKNGDWYHSHFVMMNRNYYFPQLSIKKTARIWYIPPNLNHHLHIIIPCKQPWWSSKPC